MYSMIFHVDLITFCWRLNNTSRTENKHCHISETVDMGMFTKT